MNPWIILSIGSMNRLQTPPRWHMTFHARQKPINVNSSLKNLFDDSQCMNGDSCCTLSVHGFDGNPVARAHSIAHLRKTGLFRISISHFPITTPIKIIILFFSAPVGSNKIILRHNSLLPFLRFYQNLYTVSAYNRGNVHGDDAEKRIPCHSSAK